MKTRVMYFLVVMGIMDLYSAGPKNFRMLYSSDNEGLKFPISASKQFSENELRSLKRQIKEHTIIIVDLRKESHGFHKGIPTWRFQSVVELHKGVILNKAWLWRVHVESEQSLVERMGLRYQRLPIPDRKLPSDSIVDKFVDFVENLKPHEWIHFHCWQGKGRTTTALCMYELLKNPYNSFYKIINRHRALGGSDFTHGSSKHYRFLKRFYCYCSARKRGFKGTWSEWNRSKQLKNSSL